MSNENKILKESDPEAKTTHSWYGNTIVAFNHSRFGDDFFAVYDAMLYLRHTVSTEKILDRLEEVKENQKIIAKLRNNDCKRLKTILRRLVKDKFLSKGVDEEDVFCQKSGNLKLKKKSVYSITNQIRAANNALKNIALTKKKDLGRNFKNGNLYCLKLKISGYSYIQRHEAKEISFKHFLLSELLDLKNRTIYTTKGFLKEQLNLSSYTLNKIKSIKKQLVKMRCDENTSAFNYGTLKKNVFTVGNYFFKDKRGTGWKIPAFLASRLKIDRSMEIWSVANSMNRVLGRKTLSGFDYERKHKDYLLGRSESCGLWMIRKEKFKPDNGLFSRSRRKEQRKFWEHNNPKTFVNSL